MLQIVAGFAVIKGLVCLAFIGARAYRTFGIRVSSGSESERCDVFLNGRCAVAFATSSANLS